MHHVFKDHKRKERVHLKHYSYYFGEVAQQRMVAQWGRHFPAPDLPVTCQVTYFQSISVAPELNDNIFYLLFRLHTTLIY